MSRPKSNIVYYDYAKLIETNQRVTLPEAFQSQLLIPREAAYYLRMTPRSLANWRVTGKGPRYCKLGGIRYRVQDLMDFVEAGLRNSTSDTSGEAE